MRTQEQFDLSKLSPGKTGFGNVLDFGSNSLTFKRLGFTKIWTISESECPDRRGWYIYLYDALNSYRHRGYNYGGWAQTRVYGRMAYTFYGKE